MASNEREALAQHEAEEYAVADREKFLWILALLVPWTASIITFVAVAFSPGPNAQSGLVTVAWLTIASTAIYLLVLSWRWFYVTGRKNS